MYRIMYSTQNELSQQDPVLASDILTYKPDIPVPITGDLPVHNCITSSCYLYEVLHDILRCCEIVYRF